MQMNAVAEVSLFVRDRETGRLVFNSEAIRALGLSPVELKQRVRSRHNHKAVKSDWLSTWLARSMSQSY
jgi:hypothetical protein